MAIVLCLTAYCHKMIFLTKPWSLRHGGVLLLALAGIIQQARNTLHKQTQHTLSHMSAGMMLWPLPHGQVAACQVKPNGNTPRELARKMSNIRGVMMTQMRRTSFIAIFGKVPFPPIIRRPMAIMAQRQQMLLRQMTLGFIKCLAMSGSGHHKHSK